MQVARKDEMMLITDRGTLVRTRVEEVSVTSRNTQGVMLIRLGEGESLIKTVRIDEPTEEVADDATLEDDALPAEAKDVTNHGVETPIDDAAADATSDGEPDSDEPDSE